MGSSKCCPKSYEPLAYCDEENVETLDGHISTMLSVYDKYFGSRGWEQLSAPRANISKNIIGKVVKCTIILHDMGKLFYQNRIKAGRGAALHEYYSLLVTEEISKGLIRYLGEEKAIDSMEWAILVHHMSLRDPVKIFSNIVNIAKYWKVPLSVKMTKETSEWISRTFSHHLGFKIKLQADSVISLRKTTKVVRRLTTNLLDFYPLALRLTRVLIITDNYAAALNRGGAPTKRVFLRDLPIEGALIEARRRLRAWL